MNATDREQLATATATYIHDVLMPRHAARAASPGITIVRPDGERPPTAVEDIAAALLNGEVWTSWLDPLVETALHRLHAAPADTTPAARADH
ncbi:hypothetical protein [Sphaerobacter sp.]|uniref:hypothetical protein n=1 Tax=Sphaerobacter sp. TaxID=2099654 RepID=UPI001D60593B|nr:hypothetical protein [Sphaerobacter sp.]MBX5446624.1 hypothetical protein [Sphaerobacter sp.]